jgi:hypothetical protein
MNLLVEIMKKCKKCNVEGNFRWDNQYFENSGKWRLWDSDRERPHECEIKPDPQPEEIKSCPHIMCDKRMPKSKIQDHVKKEHIDWRDYS